MMREEEQCHPVVQGNTPALRVCPTVPPVTSADVFSSVLVCVLTNVADYS